jgi:hypothetical protein
MDLIQTIYQEHHYRYGYRRVHAEIVRRRLVINLERVGRLIKTVDRVPGGELFATVLFIYDADNRLLEIYTDRAKKKFNNIKTKYASDSSGNVVQETCLPYLGQSLCTDSYVYENNKVKMCINRNFAPADFDKQSKTYYYYDKSGNLIKTGMIDIDESKQLETTIYQFDKKKSH